MTVSNLTATHELGTYTLFSRHAVEVATAAEGVTGPLGGPLRLLSLDGLFERAAIVTFSVKRTNVSFILSQTLQYVHATIGNVLMKQGRTGLTQQASCD